MVFILGVIQSLLASIIYSAYNSDKTSSSKVSFETQAENFHSKISPYLIEFVLPLLAPDVVKKLFKYEVRDKIITLPYIELSSESGVSISKQLQTNTNNIKVNKNFISWLINNLGKSITNDPTFSLNSISSNNELSIRIGSYYSTISSSDIHYYNLVRYFPANSKIGSYFAYNHGKYVKSWVRSLSLIVKEKSFSHYDAGIGCSVLTVMKSADKDGSYKYVLKTNSDEKNSAHDSHVIPSFMFQPIAKNTYEQERELDLELSVVREYGEELLGLKELESAETVDSLIHHISKNNLLDNLYSMIKNKEAHLEVTGFVLDIYRLRPEITFLLIIHDDIYSKSIKTNWETKKKSIEMVGLNDSDAYCSVIERKENPLCSSGLAALINGRKKAIALLKKSK